MRILYSLFLEIVFCVLLSSVNVFSQNHYVTVVDENPGYNVSTIEKPNTNGNYEVLTFSNTSSDLTKIYKNNESSTWPTLTSSAVLNSTLNAYAGVKTFIYNGKATIAYQVGNSQIQIAQWNAVTNSYQQITSTPINQTNLGTYFDVKVNPVNNQLYVAYQYAITSNSIYVAHYNGSSWINDLSNYTSSGLMNFTNPKIYFKNDTLYLAGICSTPPNYYDTLIVYKQNYQNFNAGSLIPLTVTDTNLTNADIYTIGGNTGQDPYFATCSMSNGNLYLAQVQGNKLLGLASKNYPGLSAAKLDLFMASATEPNIAISTETGGIGNTELLHLNGGNLQNINGSIESASGTISINSINGIQSHDGKHALISLSKSISGVSESKVFASNTKPVVFGSIDYIDTICYIPGADFNTAKIINKISFKDSDNDKVFIVDILASNGMVLNSGIFNYTVELIERIGQLSSYRISSTNVGGTGVTDLSIVFSDGFETDTVSISNIYSLSSAPIPTQLNSQLQSIYPTFCSNASYIDFKQVTNPYQGIFYADSIEMPNGLYPVSQFTGNEYFVFSYLDVASGCYSSKYLISPSALTPPTASVVTTATACDTNTGTANLTYSTPGAGLKDIYWSAGFHDSTSLSHLYAGQYLVTVKDSNNCIATAAANVEINGLSISENILNEVCAGSKNGSIQITVTGTDGPYTYLWSNGKSTAGINNLGAGTYQVVVTSASGCEATKSFTITQPLGPVIINDYSPYPPDCGIANGQLDASPSGGLSPYVFQWSTGASTQTLNNLSAGIYHVKVSDALGCSSEKDIILNDYSAPSVFASAILKPSCGQNDGYIAAELSDMNQFSSVSWNNGATTMFNGNLSPGNYVCHAITESGCNAFKAWNLGSTKPMQNNICMLTVDTATNTNLIVWEKTQNNMDHYNIYREGSVAGNFELIDTVSGLNYSIFNDVVASPKVHSWRYKISAVNQCGEEGPLSEVHKTIHIVIAQSLGNTYNVSWDEYEGFSYSTVYLWRYTNTTGWLIVDSLPSNVYSYTDNVPNPLGLDYMIEIKPPSNCSVGKAQDYNSSRSNKCSGHMLPGVGTGASNNGIEEYTSELPISMYPNPSTGMVNFSNENNEITQVSLVNGMGQTVEQFNFISSKIKDFSHLEAGIYFVKFTVNNKSNIQKLIIN